MAKAPAKPEATETAATAEPPKGGGKKKLVIIAALVVVLLGAGGAGAWLFLKGKDDGADAHAVAKAKAKPDGPPVFVNLEAFTVNLQPENGEQYLQAVAVLRVEDKAAEEKIKAYMPEVRHKALMLLSSKRASEITNPQGRQYLADELRAAVNRIVDGGQGAPAQPATMPIGIAPAHAGAPESAAPAGEHEAQPAPQVVVAAPPGPVLSVLFTSFIIQ